MEFNSYIYIFAFLPTVFVLYFVLSKYVFLSNILLILSSVIFYCWIVFWYFIPLLVSATIDYYCGKNIDQCSEKNKKRKFLVISVVVNLSLMSFFKYTGWISGEISAVLAIFSVSFSTISLVLPPGISFYTFQTMSYTIDIYRGDMKPKRGFINYFSFVAFFPQLVAGPIERARNLLPQLSRRRELLTAAAFSSALFLILFGLFQKMVLADNFGNLVDFVLRSLGPNNNPLPPGLGLVFTYAFAFQIYCDFAAYSTIARGTARLFSVELSRNFLTPYFSTSPSEFWTRWHISLSSWLRDYLYIPLGGNQGGRLLTLRNLVIVMVLGGLWHGAGIFFIVWGLYHGLLLVLYRLVPIDEFLIRRFGRIGKLLAIIIFFHFVCLGWIFFRSTPDQFWPILQSILALPGALIDSFARAGSAWLAAEDVRSFLGAALGTFKIFVSQNWNFVVLCWGLAIFVIPVWLTDWLAWRRGCEFPDLFERMPWVIRGLLILLLVYAIVFFARREANEFIYFAF